MLVVFNYGAYGDYVGVRVGKEKPVSSISQALIFWRIVNCINKVLQTIYKESRINFPCSYILSTDGSERL